jgi:hypothetical protein
VSRHAAPRAPFPRPSLPAWALAALRALAWALFVSAGLLAGWFGSEWLWTHALPAVEEFLDPTCSDWRTC